MEDNEKVFSVTYEIVCKKVYYKAGRLDKQEFHY